MGPSEPVPPDQLVYSTDYGGYLQENIVVLSDDDEIDPNRRATKENILRWMDWLVDGAKEDDSLFFHCASYYYTSHFSLRLASFKSMSFFSFRTRIVGERY